MTIRWWALLGITASLLSATWRLAARGVDTVSGGLSGMHWVILVLLTIFFVYFEGVRGFQQRFVPGVRARLTELPHRSIVWNVLAPLYGMSLVGAPAAVLVRRWLGITAIVTAVILVRALPAPWRGIVDVAVAAALAYGTACLVMRGMPATTEKAGSV